MIEVNTGVTIWFWDLFIFNFLNSGRFFPFLKKRIHSGILQVLQSTAHKRYKRHHISRVQSVLSSYVTLLINIFQIISVVVDRKPLWIHELTSTPPLQEALTTSCILYGIFTKGKGAADARILKLKHPTV